MLMQIRSPLRQNNLSNQTRLDKNNKTANHEENSLYYDPRSEYEWRSNTELDDIFISVKTTKKNHNTRLKMIVETWFQLAKDQVSLESVNIHISPSSLNVFCRVVKL
jgi:Fringe-like